MFKLITRMSKLFAIFNI